MPETRPPRQHQRRIRPDELARLVGDYVAGVEVIELARRYGIARQTVLEQMRREGVPRRHPRLSADDTERAAGLYRTGDSLATVGGVFGVDPGHSASGPDQAWSPDARLPRTRTGRFSVIKHQQAHFESRGRPKDAFFGVHRGIIGRVHMPIRLRSPAGIRQTRHEGLPPPTCTGTGGYRLGRQPNGPGSEASRMLQCASDYRRA